MFSGGLDSLACLYLLLIRDEYKDYEIIVYHVNLINLENRTLAESIASNNIVEYFKTNNYRKFIYLESVHQSHAFTNGNFPWDTDVYNFIAGSVCYTCPSIEKVVIGRTKTDDLESQGLSNRIDRANTIFNSLKQDNQNKLYLVNEYTKLELYKLLPEDLRELSWSCRTPSYKEGKPIKCKRCKNCLTTWK